MAFLDNSGDIILDAVLTDTGRLRLAQGNGSFKITQFAFGDDEINYGLYNKNHPSGSAYYDLDILQTPVFEAFTNNASSMKYQLISNVNTQLLYLPLMRLNTLVQPLYSSAQVSNTFLLTAASTTTLSGDGILNGNPATDGHYIVVDQGLDSSETPNTQLLADYDATLAETNFLIELNNNFVSLVDTSSANIPLSYVDDDGIATYSVSYRESATNSVVTPLEAYVSTSNIGSTTPLNGSRDKRISFKLKLKTDLNYNNSLYERFGGTIVIGSVTYYYIDTYVTIKGVTVGTQITIPIKIVKST
jgi:hypothetical protein